MPTMELGRLQVLVELVDRLSPAIDAMSSKVREVADNIVGMSEDTKRAWQDAGRMVGEQVVKFAQTADELVAMSEKTGVGIEALQRLKFAAEQSGTGLDQVVNAIGQMSRRLGGEGGKAVNAALDEIGVSLDNLKAMNPEEAFLTIAQAIDQMPPSFDRSKAAADIFGARVGQEILPMVTGKLTELMQQAPVTAEANVRAMADAGDAYEGASARMDASLGNLIGSLVQKVGPDVAAIGSAFGTLLQNLAPLTPALVALWPTLVTVGTYIGGALVTAVGAVLSPIGLVVAAVVGLGVVWMNWGEDIKGYVRGVHEAATEWLVEKGRDVREGVRGSLTTMKGYWTDFTTKTTETVRDFAADIKDWFGPKIRAIFEATKAIVNLFLDYHVAMISAVGTRITQFLSDLRNWFGAQLRTIVTGVQAIINPIVTYFTSVKDRVITIAQQLYQGVLNWLVTQFQNIVNGVKSKIDAVVGFFDEMYQKVVGGSIVPDMINGIGNWFDQLDEVMVAPTEAATGAVVETFNEMPEKVNFQELINKWGTALDEIEAKNVTFKDRLGEVWDTIRDSIGERIGDVTRKFADALEQMLTGQMSFKEGMASIWNAIKDAIIGVLSDLITNYLNNWVKALDQFFRGIGRPSPPGGPVITPPPPTGPPSGDRPGGTFASTFSTVSGIRGTSAPLASGDTRVVQTLQSIDRQLATRSPDILFVPMKPGDTMESLESRLMDHLPRRILQSATLRNAMQRAILGAT